jgi:hypothetical protein
MLMVLEIDYRQLEPMLGRILGARHLSPQGKSSIAKKLIMRRFHVAPSNEEKIIDRTVGGEKILRLSRCFCTRISSTSPS